MEIHISSLSSELDRFQKRTKHPKHEDRLFQEGDPTIPEVGEQTEPATTVGSNETAGRISVQI